MDLLTMKPQMSLQLFTLVAEIRNDICEEDIFIQSVVIPVHFLN